MKCFLQGVAGFVVCWFAVALFMPNIRAGGASEPKTVPIKVRVIDSDVQAAVAGATVTFIPARDISIDEAMPPSDNSVADKSMSAVTDSEGFTEVKGTFRAIDNRRGGPPWERHRTWYHVSGEWLRIAAPGRPTTYVWLNGHGFQGERDCDNDQPLEVIAVLNKAPGP